MLERGRLKGILMVALTWVAFGLFFFSKTDAYKKIVHPDKYWKNNIETLERQIAYSESELANARLERQKLAKVSESKIIQAVNQAASLGTDPSEARASAVREEETESFIIQTDIDYYNNQIETDKKGIIKAKAELAKHLGSQGGAN